MDPLIIFFASLLAASFSSLSGPSKLHLLKRAADALYEYDPDWFIGGCAEVSLVLQRWAEMKGISGVEVQSGYATTPDEEVVLHAWLLVDGEVFDPVWWGTAGQMGLHYKSAPAVLELLSYMDDPELCEHYYKAIDTALKPVE